MPVVSVDQDQQIESRSPATGQVIGIARRMTPDEATDVVARARAAAPAWSAMSIADRCRHLRAIRRAVADDADDLAATISAETGKSLADAYIEVGGFCTLANWSARWAPKILSPRRIRTWPLVTKRAWVDSIPYGVVAQFTPWNAPVGIAAQVMPSALAAGNVIVLKPSELAPLTGVKLAAAINRAGIELVFAVTGFADAGQSVISAGVDKIAFTGSTATARHILAAAAETLTPSVMELGGKDAMIVDDSVNVARAARAAVSGAFYNAGQACTAPERVYVVDGVYDEFVEQAAALLGKVRQGEQPNAHLGPLAQESQLRRIEQRLASAQAAGARVLGGGGRRPGAGSYLEPTLVVDVDSTMELMCEETFGPVLAVQRVASVEEAIALANQSRFGLNGSVFSKSTRRAMRIARRLVTGGVNVNDAMMGIGVPTAPFGGTKASGFGRLLGPEGLREFSQTKTIVANRCGERLPTLIGLMVWRRPRAETVRRSIRVAYGSGLRRRRTRPPLTKGMSRP